ncbi:hypothetical protein GCM10029992_14970 [Glycomyces albus]
MLDGAAKLGPLFKEAERLGQPAIAMTDHGNMYGGYAFYQQAKKSGVKPILGIEAYLAPTTGSTRSRPGGASRASAPTTSPAPARTPI